MGKARHVAESAALLNAILWRMLWDSTGFYIDAFVVLVPIYAVLHLEDSMSWFRWRCWKTARSKVPMD
jgi:hypothetical protein